MNTINFNDLPCDIKSLIFKINKDEEQREENKNKYDEVMNQLYDMTYSKYPELGIDSKLILMNIKTEKEIYIDYEDYEDY
tara:strand:+ start:3386 stop:3625 length:240 start_codon:yes stop_codon:yes gene_type:complete